MLDFSEISEDGTQFELLVREILFSLNYHVIWSGVGADGGRDLLVREEIQSIFGRRFFTWLVQCKHFAKSKRSVGVRDLDNVVDSCVQHGADGYLLVSSTYVSSAVVNRLEAINADRSKHLATNFWDCTILERLLNTPENWGIAQRFLPISSHAHNWQLSRTTQPNSWVVNYRGHHIILNNRIGSSTHSHFSSIKHRVNDIEKLELDENHFLKIRSVYYDDKNGSYLYYLDYMLPYDSRKRLDPKLIARALGEGYALEDGQTYQFDIRSVRYLSVSDHYDPNHYDYYVPYTGSFLVGERRALEFERDPKVEGISIEYRCLTSKVDAARDSAFEDFCEALKEAPWLRFVSGENACMEFVEDFKKSSELLAALGDSFRSERLTSCQVVFDMKDAPLCHKMFEEFRQDLEVGFFLSRNYVYVPHENRASYEADEYLYFLEISLSFYENLTTQALRNKLNLYLVESASRIREFVRRNRK
jgi:Restriction endonuclease